MPPHGMANTRLPEQQEIWGNSVDTGKGMVLVTLQQRGKGTRSTFWGPHFRDRPLLLPLPPATATATEPAGLQVKSEVMLPPSPPDRGQLPSAACSLHSSSPGTLCPDDPNDSWLRAHSKPAFRYSVLQPEEL